MLEADVRQNSKQQRVPHTAQSGEAAAPLIWLLFYVLIMIQRIESANNATPQLKVAGIGPVEGIPNVHNIDLTSDPDLDIDLVYGHDDYRENLHAILYKLGLCLCNVACQRVSYNAITGKRVWTC
jgi:hypothetical protein